MTIFLTWTSLLATTIQYIYSETVYDSEHCHNMADPFFNHSPCLCELFAFTPSSRIEDSQYKNMKMC